MPNPIQKNDDIAITIDDLTNDGAGIGRAGGFALFVPGALPGEVARCHVTKVKKSYGFAKLLSVEAPSPSRVKPVCPLAGRCGGCTLQHMAYDGQLAYKEKRARDSLARVGGFAAPNVPPIIGGPPLRYRNKASMPVRLVNGKPEAGFYAIGSHRLIPVDECPLQLRPIAPYIRALKSYMAESGASAYDEETGAGDIRHLVIRMGMDGGAIVCVVANGGAVPKQAALAERMAAVAGTRGVALNINTSRGNVILGDVTKTVWGEPSLTETIGGLAFQMGASSFFQVNPTQTARLYEAALQMANIQRADTVIDAYCGVGTMALLAAKSAARVVGIEIAREAVDNANENKAINGIHNADFIRGASADVLGDFKNDGVQADVLIVDPPRAGCDAQTLEAALALAPAKILYVSCDPATLARDLKALCAGGAYALKIAQPVDMFPQSMHVETAALLEKIQ